MLARLRKRHEENESGFTLIELLVVIIIIGILAAIAIPTFLNQRKKGWDSAMKSALKNAATAQESYFTDNSAYTTDVNGALRSEGFNSTDLVTVTATVDTANNQRYCLTATHSSYSGRSWYLGSGTGKLSTSQAVACT